MKAAPGSASLHFDMPVPMRDGVTLYADVYIPEGSGPFPALLTRTPYDKSSALTAAAPSSEVGSVLGLTRRGFAVVVQDTRGRYRSEGEFVPFVHEANDGFDSVEWVAAQSWSDGNVGMFGSSYVGATQWLAATERPPHLRAIFPAVTASDYHEGWTYQGGAFQLGFNFSWTMAALTVRNAGNLASRLGLDVERLEEMIDDTDRLDEGFKSLPLINQPALRMDEAGYYFDWLSHPSDDDFWKRLRIEDQHENVNVPSLNIGGWHDIFLRGTIRNFLGMRERGGSETAKRESRLVIGPWSHYGIGGSTAGTLDFGLRASMHGLDLGGMLASWGAQWLKDDAAPNPDTPPVKLFIMGVNRWRDENEWPLARARRTRYHLHSGGRANTRHGDGVLSTAAPDDERPDSFLYNPLDPAPTRGGPLCCSPSFLPAGPMDHAEKEDRSDVLVYSTPPLEEDVEVTGPVKAIVWAASSAVDTDFTAMLLDVEPCGAARNLCDGIVRARYRRSRSTPELLEPGRVERFEIDLVATANVFQKRHRIRLEISSSNFPRFDRNLNTGKGFDDAEVAVAANTVLHDADHPSYLELDVVPR
ncbi:MAG: CocE/NonD family hydrolase [Dehalococcoidia bacterium]